MDSGKTKEIPLTQGYVALVNVEDYERVMAVGPWHADVDRYPDGSVRNVYAVRSFRKADDAYPQQPMHRFVLGVSNQKILVDHRDHNGLNNRKKNLRLSSCQQNGANRRMNRCAKSKHKGLTWEKDRKRWRARITVNGKQKRLGSFKDERSAALAYDSAAREFFEEFAWTNFPTKIQPDKSMFTRLALEVA